MSSAKPFVISKDRVVKAFELVKANAGAAGVDEQTLEMFGENLKANLYKIWNRMSSGSYFSPPVKAVEIPKRSGGSRILGVPTVADRVAQMVVKLEFEPLVEPLFLPDSFGYRPGKSALDAIGVTRKRCWELDWVLEFDIRVCLTTFDTIYCRRQYVIIQTAVGCFCTSKDGWSRPFGCQMEARSQEIRAFRKEVW